MYLQHNRNLAFVLNTYITVAFCTQNLPRGGTRAWMGGAKLPVFSLQPLFKVVAFIVARWRYSRSHVVLRRV